MYEMFNEEDWYKNKNSRKLHEKHFLKFFKKRCNNDNVLLSNSDHIAGDTPHLDGNVSVVSHHGGWTSAWAAFEDFAFNFYKHPVKP